MAYLEIENLSKVYKGNKVLDSFFLKMLISLKKVVLPEPESPMRHKI